MPLGTRYPTSYQKQWWCNLPLCMMLNMFPKSNNIAEVAPRESFTEVRLDYKRDCKLRGGEYVQVHAENDITNTIQARTFGASSLRPDGNMQGTYLFLSLTSWKIIRIKQR